MIVILVNDLIWSLKSVWVAKCFQEQERKKDCGWCCEKIVMNVDCFPTDKGSRTLKYPQLPRDTLYFLCLYHGWTSSSKASWLLASSCMCLDILCCKSRSIWERREVTRGASLDKGNSDKPFCVFSKVQWLSRRQLSNIRETR